MKAKDVMSAPIEWVHPSLPIREAARRMKALKVGCLPVGEDGRLRGVLTDRDIVCRLVAEGRSADHTRVCDAMTEGVVSCLADQDVREVAEIMRASALRRLPVLDRQGKVVGLLSVDDLCETVPDALFAETLKAVIRAHHTRDETGPDSAAA